MTKSFTLQEAIDIATTKPACYTEQQVRDVYDIRESMTIIEIVNSSIDIKDKVWFLYNACELTQTQKTEAESYKGISTITNLENTLIQTLINFIDRQS